MLTADPAAACCGSTTCNVVSVNATSPWLPALGWARQEGAPAALLVVCGLHCGALPLDHRHPLFLNGAKGEKALLVEALGWLLARLGRGGGRTVLLPPLTGC
jgi:hypothetical protein